jgi:Cu-Zn family superoxide dismutase
MAGVLTGVALALGLAASGAQAQGKVKATATIAGCLDPNISGLAVFKEKKSEEGVKEVDVSVVVQGLPPGKHAVHIHEAGVCTPCGAAGGHFDPGPASLPSPDGNHPYHAGDLINIVAKANGAGAMEMTTSRITLSPGPLSVFDFNGSALIIHVGEDTYCPNGPAAGCAGGARLACGVLQLDTL